MIELEHVSPWLFLVAPLVIIVAYTVFGLSGFGSTVISVPILAHFLPVSYLVPLMALLDMVSAIAMGTASREHLSKEELKRLVPWMFVGFVIGVTVLVGVPDRHLRAALGIFSASIGAYSIFNPTLTRTISGLWAIPAGLVGGAVATIFGAGGPIYATYMSGRLRDKSQIRATISTLISISAFSRAVLYAISGLLLHMTIFVGGVALSPFVWIGLRIGHRIHTGLTQEQMRRALGVLMVVVGLSLLVRVAWT
jgi:uncharacterized membrane protein YfcA